MVPAAGGGNGGGAGSGGVGRPTAPMCEYRGGLGGGAQSHQLRVILVPLQHAAQSAQSVPSSHQSPDLPSTIHHPPGSDPFLISWQIPSPAVPQVSRHFEVVPAVVTATTSASANEVQMNDSHASRARSSEEVDIRLLRFRRGTESVTANAAPAVLARWAAGLLLFCLGLPRTQTSRYVRIDR